MQYITSIFAQTYGSGSYNSATYGQDGSTSAGSSTSGGILTNTGFDIALIISLACLITFVALMVRFWKRPKVSENEN